DTRLTAGQRATLLRWLQADLPRGDPARATPPREWSDGWTHPDPDLVIETNRPFHVPATGVLDYVPEDSDFVMPERAWVQGIEIRPSCPEVVHHLAAFVTDPDRKTSYWLEGYLPGKAPTLYPDGVAKLLKKGATFHFSVHYTTNGKPCDTTLRM